MWWDVLSGALYNVCRIGITCTKCQRKTNNFNVNIRLYTPVTYLCRLFYHLLHILLSHYVSIEPLITMQQQVQQQCSLIYCHNSTQCIVQYVEVYFKRWFIFGRSWANKYKLALDSRSNCKVRMCVCVYPVNPNNWTNSHDTDCFSLNYDWLAPVSRGDSDSPTDSVAWMPLLNR